ncbi:hypothetical protein CVT25_003303 [Psilocybe cyanescens]|uniref:Uncharacterized protein n=1 Tax=Psilocybe cyanescens TaxID=93625 RepID=A0A409WMJ9_PSICY|nr:hypothetical protein CVT25_003303 [Psilocybe cyanescens]
MALRLPESSSSSKSKSKGKGKGKGKETDPLEASLEIANWSSSKPVGTSRKDHGTDWIEATINGGSVLLNIVREASSVAPVPYLKQAAGVTLKIVEIVQTVKENKAAFKRLAQQAMELIATVYSAYQHSANKAEWPPQEINLVIHDLLNTLRAILDAIEVHLGRGKLARVVYSVADAGKIEEFRQSLQAAVAKFETLNKVSSHLGLHDTLSLVLKNQTKAEDERMQETLRQAQQDIVEVHRRRNEEEHEVRLREEARRAQEEEDNFRRLEASEQEIIAQQRRIQELDAQNAILRIKAADDERARRVKEEEDELRRKREEEEAAISLREWERDQQAKKDAENLERIRREEREKILIEIELKKKATDEAERKEKIIQDVLDFERMKKEQIEREYQEEIRQARLVSPSISMKATVESEDEEEEDEQAVDNDRESESESEPERRRPLPKAKVGKTFKPKTKKASQSSQSSPVEVLGSQLGQTSLNSLTNAWQYPQYYGSPYPSPPYPALSPSFYPSSSPPPHLARSPSPLHPNPYVGHSTAVWSPEIYTAQQHAPGTFIHNFNSGNVSNVTITNSGNVPKRDTKRAARE